MSAAPQPASYDTISHKGGLSHVRGRPGMYVGDYLGNEYNSALMNLLREVVGNCVDEFMNGHASKLLVVYDAIKNAITVRDDGRGIPFGPTIYVDAVTKAESPIDKLHLATGVPNTGSKYDKGDSKAFKFAIGMNGIGIKATNALSELFMTTSIRDGQVAFIEYRLGDPTGPVKIGANNDNAPRGTTITWIPDQTILPFKYQPEHIKRYLQEVAYLNAGLRIDFVVKGEGGLETYRTSYHEPQGLTAYATKLVGDTPVMVDFPLLTGTEEAGSRFEIILKVLEGGAEITHAFVNGSAIEAASAPVAAARQAYGRALAQLWKDYPKPKKHEKLDLTPNDLRSGLLALVKILHVDPAFDSQTKTKLVNKDISAAIQAQLPALLQTQLLKDPAALAKVFAQAVKYAEARAAAEKAREAALKTAKAIASSGPISLGIYTPPLKKDASKNLLYLAEGDSAKGSIVKAAKERRPDGGLYKEYVGILALRGNVLNALEKDINTALKNTELATLVKVAGLNPEDPSDLSGMQFDKIVIATDMDAGGAHICTLLVSFFLAHFPKVIEQGRLVRVITPLFEVYDLKAKVKHFIYPETGQREIETRQLGLNALGFKSEDANKRYTIKRNKGLGEMSEAANLTLVKDPRYQAFQTPALDEMTKLYMVFSGSDFVAARRELIFKLGISPDASE